MTLGLRAVETCWGQGMRLEHLAKFSEGGALREGEGPSLDYGKWALEESLEER